MKGRGGTQHGPRKTAGAFSLAKGLSRHHHHHHHKGLEHAIIKATSREDLLPKEKHVQSILYALSQSRARNEVAYCIHNLAKRMAETRHWQVVLKVLVILHRGLRELDITFWEEFIKYSKVYGYIFSLSHFQDDSSSTALDCSTWLHKYGLYLQERLRCFTMFNHDVATYNSSTKHTIFDAQDLLEQLPALQELLHRLLACKPGGSAQYKRLIQYALSIVSSESVKIYVAITVRVVNLLDKFFEMFRNDATRALEIYKRSGRQAERLFEFYETCRSLDFGRGQKYINIKQAPPSFLVTMEEYVKVAPSTLILEDKEGSDGQDTTPTPAFDLLTESNQDGNGKENSDPSLEKNEAGAVPQVAVLLGLDDLLTGASEFEASSLALAVVPTGNGENVIDPATCWELALFTAPSSDEAAVPTNNDDVPKSLQAERNWATTQAGALNTKFDGLYGDAMATTQQTEAFQIGQVSFNPFDSMPGGQQPYYATNDMTPQTGQHAFYSASPFDMTYEQIYMMQLQHPAFMMNQNPTTNEDPDSASGNTTNQMGDTPYQQNYKMQPQQHQQPPLMMNQKSTNPFAES